AVAADLGQRIPLIVDGGATPVGLESTIVKVDGPSVTLLRPGGIAAEDIERVSGVSLRRGTSAIVAPGMLASHYAPRAAVRCDASEVRVGEALLAFGPALVEGAKRAAAFRNLSCTGDLREAAANLFTMLQELDAS